MKLDNRIQKGSVVQVTDAVPKLRGCLMVVEKVLPDRLKCVFRTSAGGEEAHNFPNNYVVYIGEAAY